MKRFLSILLAMVLVVSSMTTLVFASEKETYTDVEFRQVGSAFTVKATGFEPSEERSYKFYAAAYGEGNTLLGVKTNTMTMKNTAANEAANSTYGTKTLNAWTNATTDKLALTVDFANEAYLNSITKVRTMLWEDSDSYRPVLGSQLFENVQSKLEYNEVNVARNAATFAYGSTVGAPYMAVDGDESTEWTGVQINPSYNDYFILDLGASYPITSLSFTPSATAVIGDGELIVSGANTTKFTDKTQISQTINGVTSSVNNVGLRDKNSYRYIIFQLFRNSAEASVLGFKEIVVNTTAEAAASHNAPGLVEAAAFNADAPIMAVAKEADRCGTDADRLAMAVAVDSDPTTGAAVDYTWGFNGQYFALIMTELAIPKKLTHIAYQTATPNSYDFDCAADFLIIGSNKKPSEGKYATYSSATGHTLYEDNFDILARYEGAPYGLHFVTRTDDNLYDTGLQIFEVDDAYKNTEYKYVGLLKIQNSPGARNNSIRLRAGTIQAYTRHYEEKNVALNAPAFAYGAQEGRAASYAVDGDASTAFMSANTNASYNDYLTIDLGAAYPISSLEINLAEGSGQNFTVYGAAGANTLEREAITAKVTDLTAGTATKIATTSSESYRYIIIEQDAAETALGFNDIKINTIADVDVSALNHKRLTEYVPDKLLWHCNWGSYTDASAKNKDADPETVEGVVNGQTGMITAFFDMGEDYASKDVSHMIWQGTAVDTIVGSSGYDNIRKFKIFASNSDVREGGTYETIIEIENPYAYKVTDDKYDTGLVVFDIASVLGDTPYRYYGIVKPEAAAGIANRLTLGRFGLYTEAAE